jgi:hypothetical protein
VPDTAHKPGPVAAENPHAGQGMVVLDIGGDIGALVISAPADLAGAEIEICPAGARGGEPDEGGEWWQGTWRSHEHEGQGHHQHHGRAWPHVAVLGRPLGDGVAYSAVFPGLRAGSYELWLKPDGPSGLTADVQGASVTALDWPTLTGPAQRSA